MRIIQFLYMAFYELVINESAARKLTVLFYCNFKVQMNKCFSQ